MTKNTTPHFVIEDDVTPEKENPYTAHVEALAQAGEGKRLKITVPRGRTRDQKDEDGNVIAEGVPAEGQKDRLLFQKAANDAGYTARAREVIINDDDTVTVAFALTEKHNRGPRKPAVESPSVDESATVEPEATA